MERTPGEDDRRCVVARLTPKGSALLGTARQERGEFLREVLEALDPAEREELVRLIGKVADVLREREGR